MHSSLERQTRSCQNTIINQRFEAISGPKTNLEWPASTEVDEGGGEVLQTFVVAPMIVVLDGTGDLGFLIAGLLNPP
jgi:hypothetical protein